MAARTTKKDLESKIALLEKKLQKLTDSVDLQKTSPKPASVKPKGTLPKGTAPKPTPEYVKPKGTLPKTTASAPKPAPAQTKPKGTMPKGFTPESASKPKPAETKNAPTNMAQALEKAYENWPMTSTADYKAKTPGYTPAPNRYFARQHGVVGKTTTKDWNIQKKAVTGYTAASDQYFATKQRLALASPRMLFQALVPCLFKAFFVSAGFGLDADSGVKPFGIVPLGFVCAGAGFGADAVVFGRVPLGFTYSGVGFGAVPLGRVPFGFTDAGFGDVFWRSTESVSFWSFFSRSAILDSRSFLVVLAAMCCL